MTPRKRAYAPELMKSRELRAEKFCYGCGRMVRGIWQEYTCDNTENTGKIHDDCADNACNPRTELLGAKNLTERYIKAHDAFEVCEICGESFTAEPECTIQ